MTLPRWVEKPIDRKMERTAFDCGDHALNDFLVRYARQSHEHGASKTYVAVDAQSEATILGYYTLCPAQVEFHQLPQQINRNPAKHPIGGFRLARLAVSVEMQGKGLGGQLLLAAAQRCMSVSAIVGGNILIIDAKNNLAAEWYKTFGAVALVDMPLSLVLSYKTVREALELAGVERS